MKLKLTDSPGIAGGFYWIHQKNPEDLIRFVEAKEADVTKEMQD